jgi:hypothetical protein
MSDWKFAGATEGLDVAADVVASANQTEALLPRVDAAAGPVREAFEAASRLDDLEAARELATSQLGAAREVSTAITAVGEVTNPIETIGLLATDVEALRDGAVEAVADVDVATATANAGTLSSAASNAMLVGLVRVALVLVAFGAVIAVVARRRRRTGQPPSSDTIIPESRPQVSLPIEGEGSLTA